MKNYLILFAAFSICFGFSSCEEDEDPIAAIVGTWKAVSATQANCPSATDDGTFDLVSCAVNADDCSELTYTFNVDGTYTKVSTTVEAGLEYTIEESGTYTYIGTSLDLCDQNDLCDSFPLTVDGDTAVQNNGTVSTGCDETITLARS